MSTLPSSTFTVEHDEGIGIYDDDGPPVCIVPWTPEVATPDRIRHAAHEVTDAIAATHQARPGPSGDRLRWGIRRHRPDGTVDDIEVPTRQYANDLAGRDDDTAVIVRTITSTGWRYDTKPAGSAPRDQALHDAYTALALDGTLCTVSVAWVLDTVKVGSRDWGWDDEADDLRRHDTAKLRDLTALAADGQLPGVIIIGDDGRLWDGHHRVVAALDANVDTIRALIVTGGPTP